MTDRVDQPTRQTHTHRHKLGRRPYDRPPPSVTDSGAFSLPPSHTVLLSLTGTRVLPLFCFLGALCDVDRAPLIIYMYLFVVLFSVLFRRVIGFFSACVCGCVCVSGLVNAYVLFNASICFCFFFIMTVLLIIVYSLLLLLLLLLINFTSV